MIKLVVMLLALVLLVQPAEAKRHKAHAKPRRVVCVTFWDADVGDRVECGRLYSRW